MAKVKDLKGKGVQRQTFLNTGDLPLKKGDPIYHQDTLLTGPKSELTLSFKGGWWVRLKENTHAFLEKKLPPQQRPHHHLHLLKGDLELLKRGKSYPLWIVKKGRSILADNLIMDPLKDKEKAMSLSSSLSKENSLSSSSLVPSGAQPINEVASPPKQGLSNDKIMERLKEKQGVFFNCYKQLLKEDPFSKGQLQVHFFISPKGKTTQVQVQDSQFRTQNSKDLQRFHKCILHQIRRTRFPPFKGESIPVFFPLQFS